MLVYEIRMKLLLKKDIPYFEACEKIGQLINRTLCKEPKYLSFHEELQDYKFYTFDSLYPIEKDGIYKHGMTYGVRLRTIKEDLAEFFLENLRHEETAFMRCNGIGIKIIPKKPIDTLVTITPVVMKNYPSGYWKTDITPAQFEKRLTDNLIKKFKNFTGEALDENFILYNAIRFKNSKPIKVSYKGINLLGDKLEIVVAPNEKAQELFYMALGTGLLENNSLGCGFVNYL